MSKAELRKNLLEQRKGLTEADLAARSRALCEEILRWLSTQPFTRFGLYRSFQNEPDISYLEKHLPLSQLYYPSTIDGQGQMEFFPHPGSKGFRRRNWGLEEPEAVGEPLSPDPKTLLLIPAIAFDHQGYRLGYGKGYYDRYLSRHKCTSIGVCFSEFLLASLPVEAHDQKVSGVFCERGISLGKAAQRL